MCPKTSKQFSGKLVVFEGIDRAGKSSILKTLPNLLSDCQVPIKVCGELKSPIAQFLDGSAIKDHSAFLKTFLFATDRAWTYETDCLPSLQGGGLVLWDRYVDSAIAYRTAEILVYEASIDLRFVKEINRLFPKPDLTVFIDITVEASLKRAMSDGVIEPYNPDFLERVRREYLNLAVEGGYVVIDGERELHLVTADITSRIRDQFEELFP